MEGVFWTFSTFDDHNFEEYQQAILENIEHKLDDEDSEEDGAVDGSNAQSTYIDEDAVKTSIQDIVFHVIILNTKIQSLNCFQFLAQEKMLFTQCLVHGKKHCIRN